MRPIEEWLRAHRRLVLAAIVVCSALVRVAYFLELRDGPCIKEHLWPQWDMEFFDRWARTIAGGDYLGARPLHPFHSWHADVAAAYFAGHAQDPLGARYAAAATREEQELVARELWERWYGGTRYHQEPLYPYAVALVYALCGPDVRFVFLAQLLIGIGSNVLVYLLARHSFSDRVGLVAGALAVACSPALYYELILLRTAGLCFVSLLIALVAQKALARGGFGWWLLCGVLLGVGILLQSFLVLLLGACLGFLVLDQWRQLPRLWREAGALLLGVALALLPLVLRNLAVGAPWLSITSIGAVTFVCSNAADVPPDVGFTISRYTALVMGDSEGRFLPALLATLRTHHGVLSYLSLLLGKLSALTHWYEIPNNTNFYLYRLHAPVLRLLPVTFTLAFPLGAVGMLLAARDPRRSRILLALTIASALPMLVFYVLSRFRAPLLQALLPFAALTLVETACWLRERRFAAGLVSCAAVLILLAWTSRPLPAERPLIRIQDHSVTYAIHYDGLAREAEERQDFARAAEVLREYLRLEPPEIRSLSPLDPPRSRSEATFARMYAAVHLRLAQALLRSGREQEALAERDRAEMLEAVGRPRPER